MGKERQSKNDSDLLKEIGSACRGYSIVAPVNFCGEDAVLFYEACRKKNISGPALATMAFRKYFGEGGSLKDVRISAERYLTAEEYARNVKTDIPRVISKAYLLPADVQKFDEFAGISSKMQKQVVEKTKRAVVMMYVRNILGQKSTEDTD